jgi:C_GCAxxG_C_C family probable redox protein
MAGKSEAARASFMSGFTCSSSVFSAFSGETGIDPVTARKIATGFGAGISGTGNICGAVSGGILVIGAMYGKTEKGDDAATVKTRALVREFMAEFTRRNGSVNCTGLLGYDLSDPDDYARAKESGLFLSKCPALVRDAADILEEILV